MEAYMKKGLPLLIACALLILMPCAVAYAQQHQGQFTFTAGFTGRDQARHPEAAAARLAAPVNFRLMLTEKYGIVVGVDYDSFLAKRQATGEWSKGKGNVALLVRSELFSEKPQLKRPTMRLAYTITLPTASVSKG